MARQVLIDELVGKLGDKKEQFLTNTIDSVKAYIAGQKADCIAVVGLSAAGEVERTYKMDWNVVKGREFAPALISFCREKPYDGRRLDSALTRPVVDLVVAGFETMYGENSELLSSTLLRALTEDAAILDGIVQAVVNSRLTGLAVGQTRAFVATQLTHEVAVRASGLIADQLRLYTHTSLAMGGHISAVGKQAVGDAAAVSLAKTVAVVMMKLIAAGMGPLIVKLMATAAFKAIILTAIKKFIVAALVGVIVKAVAGLFGISTTAAVMWILAPIILAIIAREVYVFPGKLAEKVGDNLRAELDGKFVTVNQTILEKLFDGLHGQAMTTIASDIAADPEVMASVDALLQKVALGV